MQSTGTDGETGARIGKKGSGDQAGSRVGSNCLDAAHPETDNEADRCKEMVLSVPAGDDTKAKPVSTLRTSAGRREDRIGDTVIHIRVAFNGEITGVTDAADEAVPTVFADWFARQALHPDTLVFPVAQ